MNIVLLGSGNVATHLGSALKSAGHKILQVYSRNIHHAEELAQKLQTLATDKLEELTSEAEVYIISVTDSAIDSVAKDFPFRDKLLVHTSGTTPLDVLKPASDNIGVFYPIQTFSKQKELDFKKVPISIEAINTETENTLFNLASSLSETVVKLNSQQREVLHLSAVFACNFSNHLYAVANNLLVENKLNFDLLRPLIAETASKSQFFSPQDVQTGPAVRNDQLTINKHLDFLDDKPHLKQLYDLLSQDIINLHQKA